jgi:tetratricopeptide (TPR) repeat protein
MKHTLKLSHLSKTVLTIVLYLFSGFGTAVWAEDLIIKPRTYKALQEAKQDLNELEIFINKYEKEKPAVVLALQMKAHVYMQQGEFAQATREYKRALALDSLHQNTKNRLHLDIARSYVFQDQYKEALPHLEPALEVPEVQSRIDAMLLLGRTHVALNNYAAAEAWLEKGITASENPEEGWYQLLLLSYHQQNKHSKMAKMMPTILDRFPQKATYWQQWAGALMHLDRFSEASAVLEIAYLQGVLRDESNILQIVAVMRQSGIPSRAAELLEDALTKQFLPAKAEHWDMVADAWMQAREPAGARAALKKAIAISNEPRFHRKLVLIAIEQEDWRACITHLTPLRTQTSGVERAELQLELGFCAYYAGNTALAQEAFLKAHQNETTRRAASDWLSLLREP